MQNKHQFFLGGSQLSGRGSSRLGQNPKYRQKSFLKAPLTLSATYEHSSRMRLQVTGSDFFVWTAGNKAGGRVWAKLFFCLIDSCLRWHELSFHFSVRPLLRFLASSRVTTHPCLEKIENFPRHRPDHFWLIEQFLWLKGRRSWK